MSHVIRPAVEDDAEALLRMGEAFFKEAGHAGQFEFDPLDFGATLDMLARHNLLLVVEKNGQVIGMAAADVAPAFWNRRVLMGREAFWYVEPAHRKGVGRELLHALECAAKSYGATVFDVVAEEGEGKRGAALARLYRAAAYSPAETVLRKRL
ncbi:MAG: GNAT family N-acetyltransferase [Proteobacteria bacterium]|nr:GNAT family N-acetyltransferase [Pseudomonadota bacterium]